MKNITLSIDEKILAAARRYAAEQNSSVNAIVREYLADIARREYRAARARERLGQLGRESSARIGARKWQRDELHER